VVVEVTGGGGGGVVVVRSMVVVRVTFSGGAAQLATKAVALKRATAVNTRSKGMVRVMDSTPIEKAACEM
jgi:hypothetical protein